jgi:hypothetical protein
MGMRLAASGLRQTPAASRTGLLSALLRKCSRGAGAQPAKRDTRSHASREPNAASLALAADRGPQTISDLQDVPSYSVCDLSLAAGAHLAVLRLASPRIFVTFRAGLCKRAPRVNAKAAGAARPELVRALKRSFDDRSCWLVKCPQLFA